MKRLYVDERMSVYALAKRFTVADGTVKTWLLRYGLMQEREALEQQQDDTVTEGQVRSDSAALVPVVEGEYTVTESTASLTDSSQGPLLPVNDEVLTAFDQLSRKQQIAVSLMTGDAKLTYTEIAERAGITVVTLETWRKDPLFQDAVKELVIPAFRVDALLILRRRLMELVEKGFEKPDDRKLLAQISGLVSGDGSTVNIGISVNTRSGRTF